MALIDPVAAVMIVTLLLTFLVSVRIHVTKKTFSFWWVAVATVVFYVGYLLAL